MVPGTSTEGTILATDALADTEIQQQVREALDDKDAVYLVPSHPPMRSDENFVELGHMTQVMDSRPPVPEDTERRGRDGYARSGGRDGDNGGSGESGTRVGGDDGRGNVDRDSGACAGVVDRADGIKGGGACPGAAIYGDNGGSGESETRVGGDDGRGDVDRDSGRGDVDRDSGACAGVVDRAGGVKGGGACPGGDVGDGGVGVGQTGFHPCPGQGWQRGYPRLG
ncbi:uncharacterized protein LOC111257919 [Setaria italica]|uniref:uncharacterized protein LOC111257919 n=1 Tax=Setaria italica TaxID=4555 RepID=UPI000BE61949|nr:uncharacterized protein LOC111257919 [Setaria italica]